jgi:hypothetical protein
MKNITLSDLEVELMRVLLDYAEVNMSFLFGQNPNVLIKSIQNKLLDDKPCKQS